MKCIELPHFFHCALVAERSKTLISQIQVAFRLSFKSSQDIVVLGVNTHLLTRRAQDRVPSPNSFARERKRGRERENRINLETKNETKNRNARERPVTRERAQNRNLGLDSKLVREQETRFEGCKNAK